MILISIIWLSILTIYIIISSNKSKQKDKIQDMIVCTGNAQIKKVQSANIESSQLHAIDCSLTEIDSGFIESNHIKVDELECSNQIKILQNYQVISGNTLFIHKMFNPSSFIILFNGFKTIELNFYGLTNWAINNIDHVKVQYYSDLNNHKFVFENVQTMSVLTKYSFSPVKLSNDGTFDNQIFLLSFNESGLIYNNKFYKKEGSL